MSITNINEIDKWINIFYGEVLMHGTDKEKESIVSSDSIIHGRRHGHNSKSG